MSMHVIVEAWRYMSGKRRLFGQFAEDEPLWVRAVRADSNRIRRFIDGSHLADGLENAYRVDVKGGEAACGCA